MTPHIMLTSLKHIKKININQEEFVNILYQMGLEIHGKKGINGTLYRFKKSKYGILIDDVLWNKCDFTHYHWVKLASDEETDLWGTCSFEDIFEQLPEELKEKVVYHLDVFV